MNTANIFMTDVLKKRGKTYIDLDKFLDLVIKHVEGKMSSHVNDKHGPETIAAGAINGERIDELEKEIKSLKKEVREKIDQIKKDTLYQPFQTSRIARLEEEMLLLREHLNLKTGLVERKK